MKNLVDKFLKHPQQLFQIDSIGALISAVSLNLLLPALQSYIGMPLPALRILGGLAICCLLYSGFCSFTKPQNTRLWLRGLAMLNLIYCVISLFYTIQYFQDLTWLGVVYFVFEKVIVLALVWVEWRCAVR